MKFWKKKEKSKSTNPFENDSSSITTEYSQTPTAYSKVTTSVEHVNQTNRYNRDPEQVNFSMSNRDYDRDRQNLFNGHTDRTNCYDSNNQEDFYGQSKFAQEGEDEEVVQIQRKFVMSNKTHCQVLVMLYRKSTKPNPQQQIQ
ncbi:unnamed protein product [Mucor hiemalis]